jgi:hypothetical protein
MEAYENMPSEEFIARLREAAILAKAPPLVIDAIDRLCEFCDERVAKRERAYAYDEGYEQGKLGAQKEKVT